MIVLLMAAATAMVANGQLRNLHVMAQAPPVPRAVFTVMRPEPCRVEPEPTFSPVGLSCAIERDTVTVLNGWVRVGRDCEDSLHRMDFSAGDTFEIRAVEQ